MGRLRQEKSRVEVERRRERQRRLHLSVKTSPLSSTSQHTSESCLLDCTDGVYLRKCVCVCVRGCSNVCACEFACVFVSHACPCSCVVVALQHFLNHRNLLEMQGVPCPIQHTHTYTRTHGACN